MVVVAQGENEDARRLFSFWTDSVFENLLLGIELRRNPPLNQQN